MNPSRVAEPVTLVVLPFSGLMLDQSKRWKKFDLKAAFVGELQKYEEVKDNVSKGLYNVVFMTPESVVDSQWRKVLFLVGISWKNQVCCHRRDPLCLTLVRMNHNLT